MSQKLYEKGHKRHNIWTEHKACYNKLTKAPLPGSVVSSKRLSQRRKQPTKGVDE